jgi:hypothetical protein
MVLQVGVDGSTDQPVQYAKKASATWQDLAGANVVKPCYYERHSVLAWVCKVEHVKIATKQRISLK